MPPPPRRARGSTPTPAGLEDISTLTLGEVRSRLERNERVLSTALFTGTTSPASPVLSSSPTSEAQPFAVGSPTSDPFREKLLAARQHLLAREHELVSQDGMQNMDMGNGDQQLAESSSDARRRSSAASFGAVMRSGKARAVETIQAGEGKLAQNGIILPFAQTMALGERDFENATAQSLAAMSLNPHPPDTPAKSRRQPKRPQSQGSPATRPIYDPHDEIARAQASARLKAFLSFKGDPEDLDDDDDFLDEGWGMEGEYDGDGDKMALEAQGREPHRYFRGTREQVDEYGDDDEDWAEGNAEYLDRIR